MNKLLIVFICSYVCIVSSGDIGIDLAKFSPNVPKYKIFKTIYNVTDRTTNINITNISKDVGFFVIQAHTYLENVTLSQSKNKPFTPGLYVTGTNIGLMWDSNNSNAMLYIIRNMKAGQYIQILLVIHLYDKYDPVPGGCNLSFGTPVAPYQLVEYNDDTITVSSQPPSVIGLPCGDQEVQVDMYHLYLYEYDNTVGSYFNNLQKMLTIEDILYYGTKVPDISGSKKYRRMYSSYRGTGEIFAIVSWYKDRSSAYVPGVSYGCDVSNWGESCLGPVEVHWKFLCACMLFMGTFVCFFGHRFFKITLFVVSFSFGLLITYFVISVEDHFSFKGKTITAFTVGFIYGIVWLLIWRRFGIPILTVHLAFICSGFLAASLLFNTVLADIYLFTYNANFWLAFVATILLCMFISMPNMMLGHIASISFLGAYACSTALNFYFGGNLPYIIINTYRRVAVKDFNTAVIDPPIQMIDIVQALFWLVLFLFGIFIQLRHQRNKPPFPPNRNIRREQPPVSEVTPLLYPDIFAPPPSYTPY